MKLGLPNESNRLPHLLVFPNAISSVPKPKLLVRGLPVAHHVSTSPVTSPHGAIVKHSGAPAARHLLPLYPLMLPVRKSSSPNGVVTSHRTCAIAELTGPHRQGKRAEVDGARVKVAVVAQPEMNLLLRLRRLEDGSRQLPGTAHRRQAARTSTCPGSDAMELKAKPTGTVARAWSVRAAVLVLRATGSTGLVRSGGISKCEVPGVMWDGQVVLN